jgi:hypothetical protein
LLPPCSVRIASIFLSTASPPPPGRVNPILYYLFSIIHSLRPRRPPPQTSLKNHFPSQHRPRKIAH